jgi:hypothetical protein
MVFEGSLELLSALKTVAPSMTEIFQTAKPGVPLDVPRSSQNSLSGPP